MSVVGAVAELLAIRAMDRRLGALGEPLHSGRVGITTRAAKLLTGAGGALVAAAPRAGGRRRSVLGKSGAAALLGAALLERWTIFRAGFASVADPKYVVAPQRERVGR